MNDFFTELNRFEFKNTVCDYGNFLKDIHECRDCKLSETRNKIVPGAGPVPCDLMLIGEGPGADEDARGIPFVGRAGMLLTKILLSADIRRDDDIYITNIVKCRPPGNRDPEIDEKTACSKYLLSQLMIVRPKIILLIGSPSLRFILDDKLRITRARGKWFETEVPYMSEALKIMPVFHPSYLLRNASREKGSPKWLTWQDMKEIKRVRETAE